MIEQIDWRPNHIIPIKRVASCLIVLGGTVYAAVWNGVRESFLLLPEDFGEETLSTIEYWTYYPTGPEPVSL